MKRFLVGVSKNIRLYKEISVEATSKEEAKSLVEQIAASINWKFDFDKIVTGGYSFECFEERR